MLKNPHRTTPTNNHLRSDMWERGAIFHGDPDMLVAQSFGYHKYETVTDAKQAYITEEISLLELEAILEDLINESKIHDL